jgi:hypothetical protein
MSTVEPARAPAWDCQFRSLLLLRWWWRIGEANLSKGDWQGVPVVSARTATRLESVEAVRPFLESAEGEEVLW